MSDELRRQIGNVLERAIDPEQDRRRRLLDNERQMLKRMAKRARAMQRVGYSRKGIASKLGVTEDDVWELLREDTKC